MGSFAFLRPPLGDLGATYDDHLRLVGKRVVHGKFMMYFVMFRRVSAYFAVFRLISPCFAVFRRLLGVYTDPLRGE